MEQSSSHVTYLSMATLILQTGEVQSMFARDFLNSGDTSGLCFISLDILQLVEQDKRLSELWQYIWTLLHKSRAQLIIISFLADQQLTRASYCIAKAIIQNSHGHNFLEVSSNIHFFKLSTWGSFLLFLIKNIQNVLSAALVVDVINKNNKD